LSEKTGPRRDRYSDQIDRSIVGTTVSVAGWIEDMRPIGSIIFFTVRDSHGVLQAVFNRKVLGETLFAEAGSLARQSFVSITGIVKESRSKTSPFEIESTSFTVLARAVHPLPLDPTGRVDAGLDTRLDARPLDLRNPRSAAIFKIEAEFLGFARKFLEGEGFLEVRTAKIIGAATEGGAELFGFDYFGREACLAQSPQLYKEELTLSLEKVYEVGTYFRAEKSHTTRWRSSKASRPAASGTWLGAVRRSSSFLATVQSCRRRHSR
jgi:nondiscriminating aspartyl-tRNA synthetase